MHFMTNGYVIADIMSSFEEITQTLAEYEVDTEFAALLTHVQSLNEGYRTRGVPIDYEEVIAELAKVNEQWANLPAQESVTINGKLIFNDDPEVLGDIFHGNDECVVELNSYELQHGKFILHDTLKYDGSTVISGTQEIKFAGLINIADFVDDDPELIADDEDDDQAPDDLNIGMAWGIVSVDQIEQRVVAIDREMKEAEDTLEESCRRHFARIRAAIEQTDDMMERLTLLGDLEDIPEYHEDSIAVYREVLETYLNDKMPFEENIPYIVQTNGQYMRRSAGTQPGDYTPVDEQSSANVAVINLKFCVAYNEVGLPAVCLRAYDVLGKNTAQSLLSIPLRSLVDVESTRTILSAKLDQPYE